MAYFPQLSTGALVQFPMTRRVIRRTLANGLADGSTVRYADSHFSAVEWDLLFAGLSTDEAASIELFFSECEGDLASFGFLDPTGNLLAWSEDLDQEAWTSDPLIALTSGLLDPLGGDRAFQLRNNSGAAQAIQQTVMAPNGFTYCFSAWVRSDQEETFVMRIGSERSHKVCGPGWARYEMTAIPSDGDGVSFGLELSANRTVMAFGLQAEAQPGASGYKRTGSTGAVYPSCRFAQSELRVTADSPNTYSCRLKVLSNGNGF